MSVVHPVLRAQRPALVDRVGAPVLGIVEQDVDAHARALLLHDAGQLEQHSHAAGSIVGAHHRHVALGRVGVVVGPGTAIPVSHEQDALLGIGIDHAYIVGGV